MQYDFLLATSLIRSPHSVSRMVSLWSVMVQRFSMGIGKPFFIMTSRIESVSRVTIPLTVTRSFSFSRRTFSIVVRAGWLSGTIVSSYWKVSSSLLRGSMRDLLPTMTFCSEASRRLGFSVILSRVMGFLECW